MSLRRITLPCLSQTRPKVEAKGSLPPPLTPSPSLPSHLPPSGLHRCALYRFLSLLSQFSVRSESKFCGWTRANVCLSLSIESELYSTGSSLNGQLRRHLRSRFQARLPPLQHTHSTSLRLQVSACLVRLCRPAINLIVLVLYSRPHGRQSLIVCSY